MIRSMCTCSTPPPPTDAAACREVLGELMAIGMDLARLIRDEATAGVNQYAPAALPVAEAAAAFERVSRAVRRTVRMVQWLDQPQAARADDGARRIRARKEIIRAVEDGIDREAAEGEADGLHGEMLERLDSLE